MTWDLKEIQLQAHIHHFLHIILCDTKFLTYPSIFPPTKPPKNQEAKMANWDIQCLWSRKVANILIKRASISQYNLEDDKTACESGFCLCGAVPVEAYLSQRHLMLISKYSALLFTSLEPP